MRFLPEHMTEIGGQRSEGRDRRAEGGDQRSKVTFHPQRWIAGEEGIPRAVQRVNDTRLYSSPLFPLMEMGLALAYGID